MSAPELYCVRQDWIGVTPSKFTNSKLDETEWPSRTKLGLRSGELVVTGDMWPLFLYEDFKYDPENPWDGLLRSALLISVREPSYNVI
jgi:hypothetical protein